MKIYKYGLVIASMALLCVYARYQRALCAELRAEAARMRNNVATLMSDVEYYRVADSMNAARVAALELSVADYERLRRDDMALLRKMGVEKKELAEVVALQLATIHELRGTLRDTLIYMPGDTVYVDAGCIDIVDAYIDFHACVTEGGAFLGEVTLRDSLIITETVQRQRFLGFLWRTRRVRSRRFDVLSKNPYTYIEGIEVVTISK